MRIAIVQSREEARRNPHVRRCRNLTQITDISEHIWNCGEARVLSFRSELVARNYSKSDQEISVWILDDLTTGTKSARIHARPSGMNTDPELTFFRMIDRAVMIQPLDPQHPRLGRDNDISRASSALRKDKCLYRVELRTFRPLIGVITSALLGSVEATHCVMVPSMTLRMMSS